MDIKKFGYGAGMMIEDKIGVSTYRKIAFVSSVCGKITWYTDIRKAPSEYKTEVERISDKLKKDFYRKIDALPDDKAYFFLLDLMTVDQVKKVIDMPGNYAAKIDYCLDILER